jgi:hypothetical protein
MNGRTDFVHIRDSGVLSVIGRYPVNGNVLAQKIIWALQMGSKTQNCDFLENRCNDFEYIPLIYGDHLPK